MRWNLKLFNPGAGDGVLQDQAFAMFLGEDAANSPEVGLFDTWMKKTHPSFPLDLFAMVRLGGGPPVRRCAQDNGVKPDPTRPDSRPQEHPPLRFEWPHLSGRSRWQGATRVLADSHRQEWRLRAGDTR
jgi:hypothetical protein